MDINNIRKQYDSCDNSIYGRKNIEDSIGVLYHEYSKFTEVGVKVESENIKKFTSKYMAERSCQPYKIYPGHLSISLDEYRDFQLDISLIDTMKNRRSGRIFDSNYKISLNEISYLLLNSYGITHKEKIKSYELNGHIGFRNIPSAGALYPLEIYIFVLNSHISSGLYHYRVDNHSLEQLHISEYSEKLNKVILAEPYVKMKQASAVIVTTGLIERVIIKYGDRGYRFMMMEAGMVGLSLSLLSESLNLKSCMLGGYLDDKLNELLGIDGVYETVNNIIVIGK